MVARQKEKEHRFWNAVAILLFVVLCAISMALWRRVVCELMQCLWCAGLWSALIVVTVYLLGFWGRLAIVILAVAGLGSLLQVVSKAIAGGNGGSCHVRLDHPRAAMMTTVVGTSRGS
jgi:hypothetical protein